MRRIYVLCCRYCGAIYFDENQLLTCEASHLNLTLNEYITYFNLKEQVSNARTDLYHGLITENTFNAICAELNTFEREHQISS